MAPLAAPVMREVERTEQPSTNADITAAFFSMLRLYALNQV